MRRMCLVFLHAVQLAHLLGIVPRGAVPVVDIVAEATLGGKRDPLPQFALLPRVLPAATDSVWAWAFRTH